MKHLLFLAVISLCSSVTFAQQPKQDPTMNGTPMTVPLEWTTGTSHDFGKIKLNDIVSYTFEFINHGNKPITITKAEPSCSCTVPEYTKDAVLPGEKGLVKAIYTAHKTGVIEKEITVTTDTKDTVVLKINVEVIQ